jgi:ArsR family metal-binding transcriptional regulator
MLIETYDMEVISPACDPGSERWSAFARLSKDISEAMPYLNTLWKNAIYDHANHVLTMVRGRRHYALRAFEIASSGMEDREEARRVLDSMVSEINQAWDRRHEIVPCHETRQRPTVMGVYKLLPGGNCRQCGEETCFIFASKLIAGQSALDRCVPLLEPQFEVQKGQLRQVLALEAT